MKSFRIQDKWNNFYKNHQKKAFYKDRHWLWQIYPEIFPIPPFKSGAEEIIYTKVALTDQLPQYESQFKVYKEQLDKNELRSFEVPFPQRSKPLKFVLEIGCGTGSTAFPMLEKSSHFIYYGLDISSEAVEIFKHRKRYNEDFIKADVNLDINDMIQQSKVQLMKYNQLYQDSKKFWNYSLFTFVLSAQQSEAQIQELISSTLEISDGILIYDYAEGDFREQKRLDQNEKFQQLEIGKLFKRQQEDTLVIYFSEQFKDFIEKIIQYFNVENKIRKIKLYEFQIQVKEEFNRKTGQKWIKKYVLIKLGLEKLNVIHF